MFADDLVGYNKSPGDEEARSGDTIKQQQGASGKQHAECQQAEHRRYEPCPAGERHAHQ